jgi:spore germination protein GerM
MKKHIFPTLIALCVLLCACGQEAAPVSSAGSISVYRVLRPEYQTNGELLRSEKFPLAVGDDPVSDAVEALASAPESDALDCPIPSDVKILSAELKSDCVTVTMNSAYLDVTGIYKTIMDGCITLTMCSIENVNYVTICVGSEVIASKLKTEDFLLFNAVKSTNTAKVRLYFPKTNDNTLGGEYHTVSFDDNSSAERCVLGILLGGPTSHSLKRAFPIDTVLLSVYTQDGVCTVSLSDFTSEAENKTSEDAELAVYSIVDSLTAIAGVNSVQIQINGQQVQDLWGFDISHPLTKNETIIGSAITDDGSDEPQT